MSTYPPITRIVLEVYLPHFDPAHDPQVGEWVLLTPRRRSLHLRPLIKLSEEKNVQPIYPFWDATHAVPTSCSGAFQGKAESAAESDAVGTRVDPRLVFPTLREAYKKYRRRRPLSANPDAAEAEEEEDDTILYLNPRALLLTPCAPAAFGGSDFIEGFDKETGRVVFVHWQTGEVRTDAAALRAPLLPSWASEVEEKAWEELARWQRRATNTAAAEEGKCSTAHNSAIAPPLQKNKME